ncbi:MAG: hypothetical protein IKQ05_00225 [Prevotella sp.]|nr:hypothetical protein [Prevotella sp.]
MMFVAMPLRLLAGSHEITELYDTLDALIARQSAIVIAKEDRLRELTSEYSQPGLSADERFEKGMKLYDEYMAFRYDSAFKYVLKCLTEQKEIGNNDRVAESRLKLAHILAVSGLFDKASQQMASIDFNRLTRENQLSYYSQKSDYYLYQSEMAARTVYYGEYMDSAIYFRSKMLGLAPRDGFTYITSKAVNVCEAGQPMEAVKMCEELLSQVQDGTRDYAILTAILSDFYKRAGNIAESERYLLLSAISDLRGAVRENNSLRELAKLLMERGEMERAFRYLRVCIADANFYGTRLRGQQVAQLMPTVVDNYLPADLQKEAQRELIIKGLAAACLVLLLAVIVLSVLLYRRKRA